MPFTSLATNTPRKPSVLGTGALFYHKVTIGGWGGGEGGRVWTMHCFLPLLLGPSARTKKKLLLKRLFLIIYCPCHCWVWHHVYVWFCHFQELQAPYLQSFMMALWTLLMVRKLKLPMMYGNINWTLAISYGQAWACPPCPNINPRENHHFCEWNFFSQFC